MKAPRALLLDFGGVLVDAPSLPDAPPALVARVYDLLGQAIPVTRIARDLVEGARRYGEWRDTVSDEHAPAELSHAEVWDTFMAPQWPAQGRAAVRREASALSYAWTWRDDWAVRPGIPEALDLAAKAGLPMAVVSNALAGAAHRDYLAVAGLGDRFAAQLYSDEVGLRKPNPELLRMAARAFAVPVEDCWFVGDVRRRDILCARRAGAGAAVLMRSARTGREPADPALAADATVDDGFGLRDLLALYV